MEMVESYACDSISDAILAIRPPSSPRHDHYEGIPRLGAAAVGTLHAIVRASFMPNHPQKSVFSESGDRSHWRWRVNDIAEQVC